jgi:putative component of membrane protein insertase Oxa1/YidC/SpoIIIJ protein YidD
MRVIGVAALLISVGLAAYDAGSIGGEWLIDGYKSLVSPLQGSNVCNFWPTCSQFTRAAIRSRGLLPGMVIGADRLMRCNPFAWAYLDTYYHGISHDRLNDPVDNHIAWSEPRPAAGATLIAAGTDGDTIPHRVPLDLAFADDLFASGEYAQAATEYLRMRFRWGHDSASCPLRPCVRRYAGLMAGEAYLRARDFASARRAFRDMGDPAARDLGRYGAGRVLFAEARYPDARSALDSVRTASLKRQSAILTGWSFFKEYRFDAGAREFARCPTDSTCARLALLGGRDLTRRSRLLGSVLSAVLPGAGQAYSGRAGDGIYTLLTVAGAGLATCWFAAEPATRDRTRVKVSIFGALTALFYAGNIYGANIAARDYNGLQERRCLARAESLLGDVRLEPDYRPLLDSCAALPDSAVRPGN